GAHFGIHCTCHSGRWKKSEIHHKPLVWQLTAAFGIVLRRSMWAARTEAVADEITSKNRGRANQPRMAETPKSRMRSVSP
ncbi:hypothetical protein M5D96_009528, partial [Drosophila gunungcola]